MILDYLWRYPPYIILLIMIDLVSVPYPPVFLIPRYTVNALGHAGVHVTATRNNQQANLHNAIIRHRTMDDDSPPIKP